MAQRRMFSLKIIDTDLFLDMPVSARLLYYDLSMRADDDGFVASPKKIQRMIGGSDDDLKLLIVKQFIIPFESGVCVIKHWKIHNYIQKDRYDETQYLKEKSQILELENGVYELDTKCIQNVSNLEPQVRLEIGKVRVGKVSTENETKVLTLFEQTVEDFKEMRKKIKAPMTDQAIKLMFNKLNELSKDESMQIQILQQSIMNSWKGIFAIKQNAQQTGWGDYKQF